ncbi:molecular chaperone HtpG [Helicobacter canadensis]|uniref:Chaperone protein HtpG n=1 Tax=Helicobacter canadensis MIT 98-5491 TaxID=537970 RepID=C5ZVI5_9HELI|nr:molecular chaperone HtpG [Helicobacter canadensis]EES88859.1 heat shock protein 90 [Helicobacter canadensis MIT 98-5491]EFR48838.1 chaperone protein HtpG [Helicobacter canadensis MIT 98-5491]STP00127.1 chaperone protein HtpG [Helicobacter canadensis]
MAKHTFQTEVNQLLDLMIHSLYSNKEIFLRELVSNASDALDKLQYLTLTDEKLKSLDFQPKIEISFDAEKNTLTISDNGIGMNEQDLIENLGTIAKSGTKNFLSKLSGDKKKDSALIGQFGVGFYAAFMVASKIIVTTKKAGESQAYAWISNGSGEFEIEKCEKEGQGSEIKLYLKEDEKEFTSRWRIEEIIKKYSDHIPFPIFLHYTETKSEGGGDSKKEVKEEKCEQINKASALWRVAKKDLKDEEYKEFYKSLSYDSNEPLAWIHTKVEGSLEYTTLFYIPQTAPFDLYRVDYKSGVKLYVKRVFITDDDKELLPPYLRFVRGIIDSEDLPLNVSREILQQNRILATIKSASTKKIISEIESLQKDEEKYTKFYKEFGRCLKEGVYSDFENKEKLLELLRFQSNKSEGKEISFKTYKERMKEGQKAIYYLQGEDLELLKNSPLLESYKKQDIEVLFFAEEIDGFVMPMVSEFDKTPLRSITSKEALEDLGTQEVDKETQEKYKTILEEFTKVLSDEVKEVRLSNRLVDAPSCVVADPDDPNAAMMKMMKQMGAMGMGGDIPEPKPILELNPNHVILTKLLLSNDEAKTAEIAHLLLEEAKLLEGGKLKDVNSFVKRLNTLLEKTL